MTIYFIIYFIFLSFALFDLFISGKSRGVLLLIMACLGVAMVLFAGLRDDTGTDWFNYKYYFGTIENIPLAKSAMEIGYEFMVRAFKFLVSTGLYPFSFFLCLAIISNTYFFLFQYSPYPIFSLFLLLSYSLVGSGFGVRQDIAISISLLSFYFIEQRSFAKFASIIIFASLLHNSALAFLPAYWLYKFKWNLPKILICVTVVGIAIFFSEQILLTFGGLISARKVQLYVEMGMEQVENPYITLLKGLVGRLLIFSLAVGFVRYGEDENKLYNGLFNIYVFGMIIFAIFSPISLIFGRIARFYDIYQIVLVPMAYTQASRLFKIAIFVIIVAFSVLKFSSTLIGDVEGLYVPYKSIFSD
jgi:hypothetical protein